MPRSSALSHPPVAVVGGGLAGLTAATELATAGRSVVLFESAGHVGGRASTREVDGFHFNLGPRALYARGAGRAILDRLGVPFRGHAPRLDQAMAWIDDDLARLPTDAWSLLTCRWMSWRERLEAASFLGRLGQLDPARWTGHSVTAWLDTCVRRTASRQLVESMVRLTTYCDRMDALDAGAAIGQLQLAFTAGVLYLDGGWQSLTDGLRAVAEQAGVRVETGRRIERLDDLGDDGVLCHPADGRTVAASAAVLAVAPEHVDRLLADSPLAPSFASTCRPQYAACLDLALDRLPHPGRSFVQGIDRSLYISVHSAAAELAPPDGALIHALLPVSGDDAPSRDAVVAELESTLDRFQPGWRRHEVHRQVLPHMRVCHDLPSPDRRRAEVALSPTLAVAGDWVGDELLADASIASGSQAARHVMAAASGDPIQLRVA